MGVPAHEPIDPRVRLEISQWPDDAPRGAVSTFCAEHGISRKSFYELRKRVRDEGPVAVLEPRSRRPKTSPREMTPDVKNQALQVRAALEMSGLDAGPINVHEKMKTMGLALVPATATLSRIFREAGVARKEPKKRPRSSWRRFVYPAPNACWQIDGTEYVLAGGRKCVIFQIIDDHSRIAVSSHVARAETSKDAITVFNKGVAARGVPQRLLSDNGAALNPTRRGYVGQLVAHVEALGVEAITGKPYKPTTQGKAERFHQTLFRYLDQQPLAETTAELQRYVDAFDTIYNNERPHQGLPGRVTPQTAWDTTPVATPPRPKRDRVRLPEPVTPAYRRPRVKPPVGLPADTIFKKLTSQGTFHLDHVQYRVGGQHSFQQVMIVIDGDNLTVVDAQGEILIEHTRPGPGIRYVGTGQPPGPRPQASPKS